MDRSSGGRKQEPHEARTAAKESAYHPKSSVSPQLEGWLAQSSREDPWNELAEASEQSLKEKDLDRSKKGFESLDRTADRPIPSTSTHIYSEMSRPLPSRDDSQPRTSTQRHPTQQQTLTRSSCNQCGQIVDDIEGHARTHQPAAPAYRCSFGGCNIEGSHSEEEHNVYTRASYSYDTTEAKSVPSINPSMDKEISGRIALEPPGNDDQMALAYRKNQIIERLMQGLYTTFNSRWEAPLRTHVTSETRNTAKKSQLPPSQSSTTASQNERRSKRRGSGSPSQSDRKGKHRVIHLRDHINEKGKIRYACPYNKYNPRRYCPTNKSYKSCMNGFTPISNVK